MGKELMFDEQSFLAEITNSTEAKECYVYFINNLQNYQQELSEEGLSYEEVQEKLRQVWKNLIKSCQRVGFTNDHLEEVAKHIGLGVNKAIKKDASEA